MTQTSLDRRLPHWDMEVVFPSVDSEDFAASFDELVHLIEDLRARCDEKPLAEGDLSDASIRRFDELMELLNHIHDHARTVRAYVHAFVATDAQNDAAQARNSEFMTHAVTLDKIEKRLIAWLGTVDVDRLIETSRVAADHEFWVRRAARQARFQMPAGEEDLASSLSPSGRAAWSKLHGNVTSRLMVDLERPDGTVERLPMSAVRGLGDDPDPAVREAAYRAQLSAWPSVEVPLAAALNSIKGWENELNERRGWPDSIEPALFSNNVDRQTLEAMQEACIASFPDFRRYLKAKARLLGKDVLPWWDLNAPVGSEGRRWNWDEAASFIVEQFCSYSDRLGSLASRAFLERWIDAEPREGKRDGGFCMGLRADESRILVNFMGTFMSVATVAHELGHAYHNMNLVERSPYQRRTPMALAETASTFCETIVTRAMFRDASHEEKLGILNGDLVRDCMIVVAIHSRFLFEEHVYESRRRRELSPSELCQAMSDAQRECFGDALDPSATHPYMWCVSPHYYSTAYYNWPYTFGLLFGLGLYAHYEQDPDGFRAGYDDLLSSTGMADAAELCSRFGIDVRSVGFWRDSLDVVRRRIDQFEELAGA